MKANAKEILEAVRKLIFGDATETVTESASEENKAVETPAGTEEAKAEETTEKVEVAASAETPAEETTTEEKFADQPDIAAMKAEIAALREQVNVMSEYVYLKDAVNQLTKQVENVKAGFGQLLPLVEAIATTAQDEPVEEVRTSFRADLKNKNSNARLSNWATAIRDVKKSQTKTK
jgi:hypothetical protein